MVFGWFEKRQEEERDVVIEKEEESVTTEKERSEYTVAWCMICRQKKSFHEPPMYEEYNTKHGKKAMLRGTCELGHRMTKFVKIQKVLED